MPNWCDNDVSIKGTKEYIDKLEKAAKVGKLFATIFPEPDYSTTPVPKACPEVSVMFAETEEEKEKARKNEPTIREDSWWDWRNINWGTKWEVEVGCVDRTSDTEIEFGFQSAWSPPIGIYDKLVEEGCEVVANYYEGGCDFAGEYDNGEEKCLKLSEIPDSFFEEDVLGKKLEDLYGILDWRDHIRIVEEEDEKEQKEKEAANA